MKKSLLSSSSILFSFASFFVIAAGILVRSGSILLWENLNALKAIK